MVSSNFRERERFRNEIEDELEDFSRWIFDDGGDDGGYLYGE